MLGLPNMAEQQDVLHLLYSELSAAAVFGGSQQGALGVHPLQGFQAGP